MNTDELIRALGADVAADTPSSLARGWGVAVMAGVLGALGLFALTLHVRPDFGSAIETPRVLLKFAAALALAATAGRLAYRMARPGAARLGWAALLAAPAIVMLGLVAELVETPAASWAARVVGAYPFYCVTLVPMLSLAPLACFLFALSRGAPTRPRLAGLFAGLAAGGLGAAVYALHCPDDSPLFLMIWYSIAVGVVGALGATLGARILRW